MENGPPGKAGDEGCLGAIPGSQCKGNGED
jgi:hypothetical protein